MGRRERAILVGLVAGTVPLLVAARPNPPPRAPDSPARQLVDAHVATIDQNLVECSTAACFSDALKACRPAHWATAFVTIEGTPVYRDDFVATDAAGCRVLEFADYSEDYYGGCKVYRRSCPSLAAARGDPAGGACAPPELLLAREPCPNPHGGGRADRTGIWLAGAVLGLLGVAAAAVARWRRGRRPA